MRIDFLTLFPETLEQWFNYSIAKRASEKGIIETRFHNLRDYTESKHKQVDDYPYGGGSGMVLQAEPIARCLEELIKQRKYDEIIFPTPDGEVFTQSTANQLSLHQNLIFICGHYKGIDQRVRDQFVTKEISIGDYVITGGELSSAVIADAVLRLIPDVISDAVSALSDSFQDGLLEAPIYTRPEVWREQSVPKILLSGNHKEIEEWKLQSALEKTKKRRPDLLK